MNFTLNKLEEINEISLISLEYYFYLNHIQTTGMIEKEFKEKNLDKEVYFSIIINEILTQLTHYLSLKSYSALKSTPFSLFIENKKRHHQAICSLIYNSFLYNNFNFNSLLVPFESIKTNKESIFISKKKSYLLKYSIYLDISLDDSELKNEKQTKKPERSPLSLNNIDSKR